MYQQASKSSILFFLLFTLSFSYGQNVGIGTTNPVNKLTVEGKVNITDSLGIGTSTPEARLDIIGKVKITDGTQGANKILTSDANGVGTWTTPAAETDPQVTSTNSNFVPKWNGSTLVDGLIFDDGTKVGIGTSIPTSFFEVNNNSTSVRDIVKIRGNHSAGTWLNFSNTNGGRNFNIVATASANGDGSGKLIFSNENGPNTFPGGFSFITLDHNTNRVGVGTSNPSTTLHVNGTFRIADGTQGANKILTSDANGVGTWTTPAAETDPQVTSTNTNFIPKWNGSTLVDGLIFDNGTMIGLNTNIPSARLHIHDPAGNQNTPSSDLILSRIWNDNTDTRASSIFHFYSTTTQRDNLAFGVSGGGGSNNAPNVISQIKMMIQADGKVGIGTITPLAPLHVTGVGYTTGTLSRSYFNVNTGPNIVQNTAQSGDIKIIANGYFWADGGGFVATSDKRIKNIIGKSKAENDLTILNKIQIIDYTYIDHVNNGSVPQKRVIAQQLQDVYAQAVNTTKGFIPNVFELANDIHLKDSKTIIEVSKPHSFEQGDKVKLILENKGEMIAKVSVINSTTFSVDDVFTEKIFVYGKHVEDLLNVDYDAISMLNVSATQELFNMITALKAENEELKAENTAFKTDIERIKAHLGLDAKVSAEK